MPDLKAELARALSIEDQTERQLEAVAIVSEGGAGADGAADPAGGRARRPVRRHRPPERLSSGGLASGSRWDRAEAAGGAGGERGPERSPRLSGGAGAAGSLRRDGRGGGGPPRVPR